MLSTVKGMLGITVSNYDTVLSGYIAAALADLGLVGVTAGTSDPLIVCAVATYCRAHFKSPADYDRLKASYDEQKAQLISASGYGLEA